MTRPITGLPERCAAEELDEICVVHSVLLVPKLCKAVEVVGNLIIVIHLIELKVGRRFEQLCDALRLFHAGKFKQNLALLVPELLNVGGNHTKLVDTGAENIESGVYRLSTCFSRAAVTSAFEELLFILLRNSPSRLKSPPLRPAG